jgi:hypothetical protein
LIAFQFAINIAIAIDIVIDATAGQLWVNALIAERVMARSPEFLPTTPSTFSRISKKVLRNVDNRGRCDSATRRLEG